mgnify:CR=1 FL=1
MPLDHTQLSFKPINNPAPKRLMQSQIDHYNREGFVAPFRVFDAQAAKANRAYFDKLLAMTADRGSYAINCYQARAAGIWDICTHGPILDLVEDLIGPNIVCWASHFFCKLPHDEKAVPWHQDAAFWGLKPARTVTVWLAIDDADEENSAMRFIPRTHNKGYLKVQSPKGASVLDQETEGADAMGEPYSNNLLAGEVSLHADMLVHGSLPNSSDRRRTGLTLRYCPPEVEFADDSWARDVEPIICRGHDPYGHWKHHARPSSDSIARDSTGPRSVGGN